MTPHECHDYQPDEREAIEHCRDEKECAALEDALQALSKAKTSLDNAVS